MFVTSVIKITYFWFIIRSLQSLIEKLKIEKKEKEKIRREYLEVDGKVDFKIYSRKSRIENYGIIF